jgi:hypothetical protein
VRVILSQYALLIGGSFVTLIAALAAGAILLILLKSRAIRRGIEIARPDVEPALDDLRRELGQAIEAGQAAASRATAIGEKVIAAVRPIVAALRDLGSRLSDLERRADASDELSSDLKWSLRAQEGASGENARVVEGINVRQGGFEHQLIVISDQLSNLKRMIEGMAAQNEENSEPLRTINTKLAAIQNQMDGLSQRVALGETGLADLSTKIVSIAESAASLESSSQQAEQQLAALERHLSLKPAVSEQEDQNVPPTDIDRTPREDLKGKDENRSLGAGDQTSPGDPVLEGDNGKEQTDETYGRRLEPGNRGGRPRGAGDPTDQPGQLVEKPLRSRFQLVVTRDSGDWDIFAEVEPIDYEKLYVMQGSDTLHEWAERSLFGPLHDLTTPLRILNGDVEIAQIALITQESPLLLFRLQREVGLFVRRPSRGLHLAVVPIGWRYHDEKSGAPPIDSESISIPGYRAHFFSPDRNPVLVFDRPGEPPIEVHCSKPEFRLQGRELRDADEEMGPLFVADLPILEGDRGAMAKVQTVVIGAEGRGSGRWRGEYELNAARWRLPEDVRTQGSGWYFMRLYDAADDLIDSFAFRYATGLKSIDVNGAGLTQGQDEIRVTFFHDEGVSVTMIASILSLVEHSTVPEPQSTLFVWPCHPNVRDPIFEVRDRGGPVRVTLDTDRIWWALGNEPRELEPAWQSSPIELIPELCSPMSNAQLLVRFPRSAAVDAFIGFRRGDRRKIQIAADRASVYLHGFSEASEIRTFGCHKLKLWVCGSDNEFGIDVANVSVSMKCRWCDAQMNEQEYMLDHLLSQHHEHCFERLKLRGQEVAGPNAIFVCLVSGCGQYYPDSPLSEENPISRLSRHCNDRHPNNSMVFKRISGQQDIENLLGLREKWVWKCNLGTCRPITPSSDSDNSILDKKAHLREEHLSDLLAGVERTEN